MNGGQAEFEEFYRSHYPRLVKALIILAQGDVKRAEDAAQDAMTAAWRRWDSIDLPRAWVYKAAGRYLVKAERRSRREAPRPPDEGAGEPSCPAGQEIWAQQEWVSEVLKVLTPAEREVMDFILDGLRPADIALLLGKTPAAVRQNLSAARRRLRRYLGYGEEVP
jgi:RNA polymerase sigma factor (sigma-70 family)